jgi:hypothetical protein
VTPSEPAEGAPARRSRRAVRHAGTVGQDDARLVSTHPAYDRRTHRDEDSRPAVASAAPPDDAQAIPSRSADDSDIGWGDREAGSNDDRLEQDKPPHW